MTDRYRICKNCEYLQPETDRYYASCHLHPPLLSHSGRKQFPKVHEDDWCGDWTPSDYSNNPAIKAAWDQFKTLHLLAKKYD